MNFPKGSKVMPLAIESRTLIGPNKKALLNEKLGIEKNLNKSL
jgi:hypothetical protein